MYVYIYSLRIYSSTIVIISYYILLFKCSLYIYLFILKYIYIYNNVKITKSYSLCGPCLKHCRGKISCVRSISVLFTPKPRCLWNHLVGLRRGGGGEEEEDIFAHVKAESAVGFQWLATAFHPTAEARRSESWRSLTARRLPRNDGPQSIYCVDMLI
jgi:hypothetical protein